MTRWMDIPDEPADTHGDLLARILHEEAETIVPAGDGLSRIRERAAARRTRSAWWRPALAVGSAGVLAAAAAVAIVEFGSDTSTPTVPAHTATNPATGSAAPTRTTHSPAPSGTSATSKPVVSAVAPVWPFASASDAAAWIRGSGSAGHQPWRLDPGQTALAFVRSVLPGERLSVTGVTSTADGGRDVTVASTGANGRPSPMSTVHVVRYGGTGSAAPYEVTGATAPYTSFTSPLPGQRVTSPLAVQGTSQEGVDEGFEATVWNGTGGRQLGTGHVTFGQGPFNTTVDWSGATASTGFVSFVDHSASGVGISRFAAIPVTFGGSTNPAAVDYPPTFVGVRDGRVAVFYSKGGGFVRWLTTRQPGGGVQAAQLTANRQWVYYLQGQGSCAAGLWRVRYDGKSAPEAYLSPAGGPISAFALSADQRRLAYTQQACQGGGQTVVWRDLTGGNQRSLRIPAEPPLVQQLAWAPDDRHLAVTVRTGTAWGVSLLDTSTARKISDLTQVRGLECGTGYCSGPAYAPDGSLVYASSDGQQIVVYRISSGNPAQLATVRASAQLATLDLTADGTGVLLSDGSGGVWRWTPSTGVHRIATSATGGNW